MRTTITLDDALVSEAKSLTGIDETPSLIREALKGLIARESSRRLARLGGPEPHVADIPRRRPGPA